MMQMKFGRRREQRTDYHKRLRLLMGRKNVVVVRKSISGYAIQLVKPTDKGDQTLAEVNTKHLMKYGWNGHGGSMPAAYLTGFLFGKTAVKKGFESGVLDIGLQSSKSQTLFALAKGIADSGFDMPVGAEIPEERIRGGHIAKYAAHLKKTDQEKFKKQFSVYVKKGFNPEDIAKNFDEVKKKLEEL